MYVGASLSRRGKNGVKVGKIAKPVPAFSMFILRPTSTEAIAPGPNSSLKLKYEKFAGERVRIVMPSDSPLNKKFVLESPL